jgi:hypothetical protein
LDGFAGKNSKRFPNPNRTSKSLEMTTGENPNAQVPIAREASNTKIQTKALELALGFGAWEFLWGLGFGLWNF